MVNHDMENKPFSISILCGELGMDSQPFSISILYGEPGYGKSTFFQYLNIHFMWWTWIWKVNLFQYPFYVVNLDMDSSPFSVSILCGLPFSKSILYGEPGYGKSTFFNIHFIWWTWIWTVHLFQYTVYVVNWIWKVNFSQYPCYMVNHDMESQPLSRSILCGEPGYGLSTVFNNHFIWWTWIWTVDLFQYPLYVVNLGMDSQPFSIFILYGEPGYGKSTFFNIHVMWWTTISKVNFFNIDSIWWTWIWVNL